MSGLRVQPKRFPPPIPVLVRVRRYLCWLRVRVVAKQFGQRVRRLRSGAAPSRRSQGRGSPFDLLFCMYQIYHQTWLLILTTHDHPHPASPIEITGNPFRMPLATPSKRKAIRHNAIISFAVAPATTLPQASSVAGNGLDIQPMFVRAAPFAPSVCPSLHRRP